MNRFVKFGAVYLATMIGLQVLGWLMFTLFEFDMPSGLSTVLPSIMGAMICGQDYARANHEAYPSGLAWRHGLQYSGIAALISAASFGIIALVAPEILEVFNTLPIHWFVLIFFVLLGFTLLIHRYFLAAGAKGILKTLK